MLPYRFTTHPCIRALRRPWKIMEALGANLLFGFPSRHLVLVGITGTTGKTTTAHLVTVALESAGYTVGAVSSLRVKVGTRVEKNLSGLTSLGPWQFQKLLAHMARAGCHYAVVEASSHALDQQRFWGTAFDVAVITNLARDHLDYHRTFEDYAAAKRRLFRAVSRRREKILRGKYIPRVLIAPLDDPAVRFLEEEADARYGTHTGDQRPETGNRKPETGSGVANIRIVRAYARTPGSPTVVRADDREVVLPLQLPGRHNLSNALVAVAVGISQGIDAARVARELAEISSVPGRFERVICGQPFTVIVDYAVTELALASLFAAIRELKPGRVLAIFGATGNRDRGKRASMAAVVATHADVIFLTNEDPFTEDPEQIFSDLVKGFQQENVVRREPAEVPVESGLRQYYFVIPDRRSAIREAVRRARPGDVIVATGKGDEETMRFKNQTIPWSDRDTFQDALAELHGPAH